MAQSSAFIGLEYAANTPFQRTSGVRFGGRLEVSKGLGVGLDGAFYLDFVTYSRSWYAKAREDDVYAEVAVPRVRVIPTMHAALVTLPKNADRGGAVWLVGGLGAIRTLDYSGDDSHVFEEIHRLSEKQTHLAGLAGVRAEAIRGSIGVGFSLTAVSWVEVMDDRRAVQAPIFGGADFMVVF